MRIIKHLLEQVHVEPDGGRGFGADLINNKRCSKFSRTPNRSEVFKRYNYRFKLN